MQNCMHILNVGKQKLLMMFKFFNVTNKSGYVYL